MVGTKSSVLIAINTSISTISGTTNPNIVRAVESGKKKLVETYTVVVRFATKNFGTTSQSTALARAGMRSVVAIHTAMAPFLFTPHGAIHPSTVTVRVGTLPDAPIQSAVKRLAITLNGRILKPTATPVFKRPNVGTGNFVSETNSKNSLLVQGESKLVEVVTGSIIGTL